jgi:hypothetical protein
MTIWNADHWTPISNSLFAGLLWLKSVEARIVFITMLAMMDRKTGMVSSDIPGISVTANLPLAGAIKALKELESASPDLAHTVHEGRLIEKVDGGWIILGHEAYLGKLREQPAPASANGANGSSRPSPSPNSNCNRRDSVSILDGDKDQDQDRVTDANSVTRVTRVTGAIPPWPSGKLEANMEDWSPEERAAYESCAPGVERQAYLYGRAFAARSAALGEGDFQFGSEHVARQLGVSGAAVRDARLAK